MYSRNNNRVSLKQNYSAGVQNRTGRIVQGVDEGNGKTRLLNTKAQPTRLAGKTQCVKDPGHSLFQLVQLSESICVS